MLRFINAINQIDNRILFFILVVLVFMTDTFTRNTGISDLAKILIGTYGGYIMKSVITEAAK